MNNRANLLSFYYMWDFLSRGRNSSVGIATGYGLDDPGIESRWARFFAHVQTGPGAHPASCKMGTGSSPGQSGRGVVLNTPSNSEVKKEYSLPLPLSGPSVLLEVPIPLHSSPPWHYATLLHFSHDQFNWSSSSFSSTVIKIFQGISDQLSEVCT
jgi:hypothetical protein